MTRAAATGARAASQPIRVTGLPPYLRPLLGMVGMRVALIHAALEARTIEGIAAIAATLGGDVVLATPNMGRVTRFLRRILPGSRAVGTDGFRGYETRGRTVWVAPPNFDARSMPFVQAGHLIVEAAHRFDMSPPIAIPVVPGGSVWVVGVPSARGHWFDVWRRAPGVQVLRVTAGDIVKVYPEQAERGPPIDDPAYRRVMLLEDEREPDPSDAQRKDAASAVRIAADPPLVFVRKRLKVKTDKGPEFMAPSQRDEAAAVYGPDWASSREVVVPIVSLVATPLQRRYLAIKRRARQLGFRKFLLLKHRRFGGTTIENAMSYRICATSPHANVAIIAHKQESTEGMFEMIDLFHRNDPLAPRRITDSRRLLELENGSTFRTGTAGGRGFARGDTYQKIHLSEVSKFCPGPRQYDKVFDLMAGATGAASHGELVAETTASGIDWFCQEWRATKRGETNWFNIFLPWFLDRANRLDAGTFSPEEIVETLDDEERALIEKHGLTPAQIAWRRRTKRDYRHLFPQEYPEDDETAFLMTGHGYFDVERAKALLDALPGDADKTHRLYGRRRQLPGGVEITWEDPVPGEQYVAGWDTSEGLAHSDPNGGGVLRRSDGVQVCSIHGRFAIPKLAELIVQTARRYNGALTCVERNNHGHAVLQKVTDLGAGKSHLEGGWLFFDVYHNQSAGLRPVLAGKVESARQGLVTDDTTRDMLIAGLAEWFDAPGRVRDRGMVAEMLSFRLQKSGRYDHDSSSHDDSIFKWAMAVLMLRHRRASVGIY